MAKASPKRDSITELFTKFAGQANTLMIPRHYIKFCNGDHMAALLLSQILYWSDRTNDPDGWFAKSYEDWYEETCLTKTQVMRLLNKDKRRKTGAFSLADVGIETKVRRSEYYRNAPTVHFRVNFTMLQSRIQSHLGISEADPKVANDDFQKVANDDYMKIGNDDFQKVSIPDDQKVSNADNDSKTETIAETTTKVIALDSARSATRKTRPASELNPIKDAIVAAFKWQWSTMTKQETGKVQGAAAALYDAMVKPDEVSHIHAYCAARYDTFSPMALVTNQSEALKSKRAATSPAADKSRAAYEDEIRIRKLVADSTHESEQSA